MQLNSFSPVSRSSKSHLPRSVISGLVESANVLLRRKKVRYFRAAEILTMGAGHSDPNSPGFLLNELPPAEMLDPLTDAAALADEVRAAYGSPLIVLSGFRSQAYNRAIGGAIYSYHKLGMALDLAPLGAVAYGLHDVAHRVVGSRGGVGLYKWGVHIDVRGRKARWGLGF